MNVLWSVVLPDDIEDLVGTLILVRLFVVVPDLLIVRHVRLIRLQTLLGRLQLLFNLLFVYI